MQAHFMPRRGFGEEHAKNTEKGFCEVVFDQKYAFIGGRS